MDTLNTTHARNAAWKNEWDELSETAEKAELEGDTVTARRCKRSMDRIQAEFFAANSGLAYAAARVYLTRSSASNHDDYIQAARIGLLKAWPMWDPKQATFATFSRAYADGETNRAVRAYEHAHISYGDHTAAPNVKLAEAQLTAVLGRTPTDKEIAERAGVSAGIVKRVRMQRPVSLDTPIGDGEYTRGSLVADTKSEAPEAALSAVDLSEEQEESVLQALREIDPVQVAVVARRLGIDGAPPQTLSEIAELLNSSREIMRRVDSSSIDAVRQALI